MERDTRDTVVVLQAGDSVSALTGNLHTTAVAHVVVTREVYEEPSLRAGRLLQPGDTLLVLNYLGEGYYRAWMDGATYTPQGFWVDQTEWTPEASASGYRVGDYSTEWWVQVRTPMGAEGWIRGADASRIDGLVSCP